MKNDINMQSYNSNEVAGKDIDCVLEFIEKIWNENRHSDMSNYLHYLFVDHSIPSECLRNQKGLEIYLREMKSRIGHRTCVLETAVVNELIVCQIQIKVSKLEDDPSSTAETITGYRIFKMRDQKIIAHWEIFDC